MSDYASKVKVEHGLPMLACQDCVNWYTTNVNDLLRHCGGHGRLASRSERTPVGVDERRRRLAVEPSTERATADSTLRTKMGEPPVGPVGRPRGGTDAIVTRRTRAAALYLAGKSYQSIADELGVNLGTVNNDISRLRQTGALDGK